MHRRSFHFTGNECESEQAYVSADQVPSSNIRKIFIVAVKISNSKSEVSGLLVCERVLCT